MRNKILLLVALIATTLVYGQCNYKLDLYDDFGDGWQTGGVNGRVEISVAGVVTSYTINAAPGNAQTVSFDIPVNNGDALEVFYRSPEFPGDAEFQLYDSEDILVYDSGFSLNEPTLTSVFTGTAVCPTCPAIDNLTFSTVQARDVLLSWDAGFNETEWVIEYGVSPLTLGTGLTEVANTNMNYFLDTLTPETEYDVYVRSQCAPGDLGSARGPITFTTLPSCPRPAAFTPVGLLPNEVSFLITDTGGNLENEGFYEIGVSPYTVGSSTPVATATLPFQRIDNLMSNTTYDVYLRFNCGPNDLSAYSDVPFTFTTPSNCPNVSSLSADNPTFSTIDLSWTAGDVETLWQIEYGPAPLDPNTSTTINVTSTAETLTNLSSATNYEYCVTAICSALDEADAICGTFSTLTDYCGADPLVDTGGATGDYGDNENITYIICPDTPGNIVTLNFSEFNLESRTNTECFDSLTIYDGDSLSDPIITPPSGGNAWCFNRASGIGTGDLVGVALQSTSASGCITVVFSSNGSNVESGFFATVECAAPATCPAPDQVSVSQVYGEGSNLTWNSNGTETEWEVEIQPAGTAQGSGSAIYTAVVSQPQEAIRDLMPTTDYDAYVRANCSATDQSSWVGPISFTTTTCLTENTPYAGAGGVGPGNDFSTFPGNCWIEVNDTPIGQLPIESDSDWTNFDYANNGAVNGNAALMPIFDSQVVNNDWLMSPNFDLGATGHNLLLNFNVALTEAFGPGPSNFGSDDSVTLIVSNDNGLTWNTERVWNASSNLQPAGARVIVDLAAYSGEIKFAFVSSIGTVSDPGTDIEFFVDNIRIATTASNDDVAALLDLQMYPNPSSNLLHISAAQVIEKVTVHNLLGQDVLNDTFNNQQQVELNVSSLKTGVYLVTIETVSGKDTLRLVKN